MASGKSHAAKFLIEKYGYTHLSLAAPIKAIEHEYEDDEPHVGRRATTLSDRLWILLGEGKVISNELFWKFFEKLQQEIYNIPLEYPKPRKRLQFIGTDIGRNLIDPEIWIKLALHKVEQNPGVQFVCDDVRFLNEYSSFVDKGFTGLKLEVSPEVQLERLQTLYNMTSQQIEDSRKHASETEIDLVTVPKQYLIDADQNLIKMYKQIELALEL